MTSADNHINSDVRLISNYLGLDPGVAQQIYYDFGLWKPMDGLEHQERKEELENLRSLKKALTKQSPKFAEYHIIQTSFRINGFNLYETLIDLMANIDDMIDFGEQKIRDETSGTRANKRAHEVARYVAALFEADGRYVGYGVMPLDGEEPSTPFGRAVREALSIFKVYEASASDRQNLKIVNWRFPAQKAAAQYRNTKSI